MLSGILTCIQEDMNTELVEEFKPEEVVEVVKGMAPLKASEVLNRRKEMMHKRLLFLENKSQTMRLLRTRCYSLRIRNKEGTGLICTQTKHE
ncbi:hypothetical protein EPI10_028152 [Gossypium australe]|uniref:Uncharacterized protein n=1 Tax=Gossypium australe TaxID=47621 RepID=A0A5B6UW07_9ROSI|nr:hypothetical protein EPI10_028152 [Gossypium australe]